jgi:hypothetical protein
MDAGQLSAIVANGLLDRALKGGERVAPDDERAAKLLDEAIVQFRHALARTRTTPLDPRAEALLRLRLAMALTARPWRERVTDAEEAREQMEAALRILDRTQDPQLWILLQHNLGRAYQVRVVGDIAENRELAVNHLKAALTQIFRAPSGTGGDLVT